MITTTTTPIMARQRPRFIERDDDSNLIRRNWISYIKHLSVYFSMNASGFFVLGAPRGEKSGFLSLSESASPESGANHGRSSPPEPEANRPIREVNTDT